jgi:hypothetical protein
LKEWWFETLCTFSKQFRLDRACKLQNFLSYLKFLINNLKELYVFNGFFCLPLLLPLMTELHYEIDFFCCFCYTFYMFHTSKMEGYVTYINSFPVFLLLYHSLFLFLHKSFPMFIIRDSCLDITCSWILIRLSLFFILFDVAEINIISVPQAMFNGHLWKGSYN